MGVVVTVIALRASREEGVLEARAASSWGIVAHGFEVFDETRRIRKVEDLFERVAMRR